MALLTIASMVVAWFGLKPQGFVLVNRLALPVEIHTEEGVHQTLPPGGEYRTRVGDDDKVLVNWKVVQPIPDSGLPAMGPVSGLIRVDNSTLTELFRKQVRRDVDSWLGANRTFAPQVTNSSAVPLTVVVNTGPSGTLFRVMPGETRVLGYFDLTDSSSVRVRADPGREKVFSELDLLSSSETGIVSLTVTDSTFR
jgi:hypothetical protein